MTTNKPSIQHTDLYREQLWNEKMMAQCQLKQPRCLANIEEDDGLSVKTTTAQEDADEDHPALSSRFLAGMERSQGNDDDSNSHWNAVGLTSAQADEALNKFGYNEVVVPERPLILQFLGRYLGIVPLFTTMTAVLSAAIWSDCALDENFDDCECNTLNDWASFVLLLIELNLLVYADFMGSRSSGDAMKQLQEASVSQVSVKRNHEWVQLPTRELVPGDLVAVTIGMTIPADGIVVEDGDYSSLRGEPLPERKGKGSSVLSGAVVLVGEGEIIVTKTGADSSLGTTQTLIAQAKAEKEKGGALAELLSKVALFLFMYGIVAAIIIGAYTGTNYAGASVGESIKLAFVVVTAVLPATMPIVLTTTLAVGSKELAKDNAVVQRFSAIPEMAGMDVLCSDKTGTLTLGQMSVIKEECVVFDKDKYSVDQLMELALVCSRIEHSDAIDTAVAKYFDDPAQVLEGYDVTKFVPFDPSTKKVTAIATKKSTGEQLCVVKGAPPVLMNISGISPEIYTNAETALNEKSARGFKTLAVCKQTGKNHWDLVGFLSILDPPRSDTSHTLAKCNELGVEVKMITGDQKLIAIEVARQLGLKNKLFFGSDAFHPNSHDANQSGGFENLCEKAGGFAGVNPEHKHKVVTSLQNKNHVVGMTGDGVNDAPALTIADVGIAVAGATDAAKGASDIVLQQDGLSTIVNALYGSRVILKRIETYCTYRMCCRFTFGLVFTLIYCASDFNFPTWTLVLMSLLNDFAVSTSSKDNVKVQRTPQKMNMVKTVSVAASMAIVNSLQVWGFLHSIATYDFVAGTHFWGLRPTQGDMFAGCEAAAYVFLVLIITLQFNLIAARSPKPFFLCSSQKDDAGHFVRIPPPSKFVVIAIAWSLTVATFTAVYWSDDLVIGSGYGMSGIGWRNAALVWCWALLWFLNVFAQDWDPENEGARKKQEMQRLQSYLAQQDVVDEGSSRRFFSSDDAMRTIGKEADNDAGQFIMAPSIPSRQDELLSKAPTLQDDEALLHIISKMATTIASLEEQIHQLSATGERHDNNTND